MNPNNLPPYQPYSSKFTNPTYITPQNNNYPQYNNNPINNPSINYNHQFNNPQTIKNDQFQFNRNKLDKAMYTSSIQTNNGNKNFTLGKLQSMGRFVGGQESKIQHNKQKLQFNQPNLQSKQYTYQVRQDKQKIFSSFISPNHANQAAQFDRFPAFNLQDKNPQQSVMQSYQQKNSYQINEQKVQTAEQKRRRQILAIKQQLEMINKKMQNSNLNRKYINEQPNQNINNNINNNVNMNNNMNNNVNNNNNHQNNNLITGNNNNNNYHHQNVNTVNNSNSNNYNQQQNNLSIHNNNNQVGFAQRNKGMIAQSMIVSSQPTQGYKFQSIFDKYDSMKKPTYQTTQNTENQKEDHNKPLLLDQFVKKGNNLNFNTELEGEKKSGNQNPIQNNTQNNTSINTPINTTKYDYTSMNPVKSNNPVTETNYNNLNNYSKSTNSSSSASSNSTIDSSNQETNMFKKKKQNSHIQQVSKNNFGISVNQIKTVTSVNSISSPKNNGLSEGLMFKKTKETTMSYEENYVTSAMKKMNVQESVNFKKDDFVVGKKLGKGQFGEVMLVQHKKTGFLCGMKVMQKKQIRDEKYEGQIARQLSIQFYLAHRNIAPLYGYFQDQKNVYLLVEYCTGGQLLEMLRKNRRMEEPEVSKIIKQIIQGIDYIHKELIIHRDIKPQNILFNFGVAKICDFGWAVYKGHGMRKTASVGSPLYYSPQIVMGVQYDQKIDIWDIGMMTYECILGKIPFRIYSELDLNRIVEDEIKFPEYIDTSDQAKDFILKIMKKKPQERMEIRQMLRHPFITKYQDQKLAMEIMKDIKQVLSV